MKDKVFLEDIQTIHQFMKHFFKQCSQLDGHEGLNRTQIGVLIAVSKNENSTMTEISQMVGLEKGSFTTVIDQLIEKGCIERKKCTQDRRKTLLVLTSEGKKLAQSAHTHMKEQTCKLFKTMNQEEFEEVKQAVHTLAAFVQKFNA